MGLREDGALDALDTGEEANQRDFHGVVREPIATSSAKHAAAKALSLWHAAPALRAARRTYES